MQNVSRLRPERCVQVPLPKLKTPFTPQPPSPCKSGVFALAPRLQLKIGDVSIFNTPRPLHLCGSNQHTSMSQDLHDWLTLLSVPGLGPAAFSVLVQHFQSPGEVLRTPPARLCTVPNIGAETARAIQEDRDEGWAEKQMARARGADIRILTLADAAYPSLLRQIYAPPPVLFVRGTIDVCADPTVALVGSRSFTPYGRDAACRLADELALRDITVVSGMARGIDTHAHQGALGRNGRTAAVLGCGLDRPYPPENIDLFGRICETGVAISEFPLGTTPESHNFPRRNRIISGLSLGVVVVEAGERSGALITARHALEQNREVFAVPGSIYSEKSAGANRLIKQGAVLVQTVNDILQELPGALLQAPDRLVAKGAPPDLSRDEQAVFNSLSPDLPQHIDAIAARAGLSPSQALPVLLALELANRVEQRPGKQFVRKI